MNESLARQSKELQTTETRSSQDSILAEMLMLSGQIMGREIMPAEVRLWSETFRDVNPQTLEKAFRNYLKMGKFFPKPGDIWEQIENVRSEMATSNKTYTREETKREQETPEWESSSQRARERLRELAGMKEMPASTSDARTRIRQQAEELRNLRSGSDKTKSPDSMPAAGPDSEQPESGVNNALQAKITAK